VSAADDDCLGRSPTPWSPRLLEVKHAYDPGNLFRVHPGVGSETTGG
jgi:Berberine and berberine like